MIIDLERGHRYFSSLGLLNIVLKARQICQMSVSQLQVEIHLIQYYF